MRFDLVVDGEPHEVEVRREGGSLLVRVDGSEYRAHPRPEGGSVVVTVRGRRYRIEARDGRVLVNGEAHDVSLRGLEETAARTVQGESGPRAIFDIRPPMPGRVVRVAVRTGARVRRGEAIVVLEAMKMQNEIPAPADALVREVRVRPGDTVSGDRIIAVLEAI